MEAEPIVAGNITDGAVQPILYQMALLGGKTVLRLPILPLNLKF